MCVCVCMFKCSPDLPGEAFLLLVLLLCPRIPSRPLASATSSTKCQKECQKMCRIECQEQCQNICQTEWQIECPIDARKNSRQNARKNGKIHVMGQAWDHSQ